jgi:hypothetical protein
MAITPMIVATAVAGFAQTTQQRNQATAPAGANAAPPACDFAQLKLHVTSATVVGMINHKEGTVKAKEGYKLVVVRLKGDGGIPKDFELASNWSDIQAVYGVPSDSTGNIDFDIASPLGVKVAELMGGQTYWAFSVRQVSRSDGGRPFGMKIDGRQIISPAQDLVRIPTEGGEITVAFMLPVLVKEFTVRVPMALSGAGGSIVQLP